MFDYVIIGGGVVGCAIFNSLTLAGKKCALIEKENDVATGCSKANTGLVHAGFDAQTGTLKAKLNVKGNKMMPKVAKRLGIKFKKCGAIVVGDDLQAIERLYDRGIKNGVKNLSIIDENQIKQLCPNIKNNCKFALYAKNAGLINPYLLTIALAEEAVVNGGKVFFEYNIDNIIKEEDFTIFGTQTIKTKNIINASGFGFNEVSKLIGAETYNLKFRRGQYFVLDKSENPFVNITVFPLPTNLGKGIVATPTIDGNVLLGPTAEQDEDNKKTTQNGLDEIKKNILDMFGVFPKNQVIREFAGTRCYVGDDFIIEKSKLVNNLINVVGICSPGLTASVAIGDYILKLCKINTRLENPKKREPYIDFANISKSKKNKIIKEDSDFGKIVCRCEQISVGQIKQALNSPLKPKTTDAIKRRVRAGMGRCQGGFCTSRIMQILSKQGESMTKICKDKNSSFITPYEVCEKTEVRNEKI